MNVRIAALLRRQARDAILRRDVFDDFIWRFDVLVDIYGDSIVFVPHFQQACLGGAVEKHKAQTNSFFQSPKIDPIVVHSQLKKQ